jgi:serine/threonine protein phosphatase PrpC
VLDGIGHGLEASIASEKAKKYIEENYARDVEEILLNVHSQLRQTRGAVGAVAKIDKIRRKVLFCGIGNIESRVISEPPMHPVSKEGILGLNLRKTVKFEYQYDRFKAMILHSDGISNRFNLSDYPCFTEPPQDVAERIMMEWGKSVDDATIVIAIADDEDE